jgi:hypothetical protein
MEGRRAITASLHEDNGRGQLPPGNQHSKQTTRQQEEGQNLDSMILVGRLHDDKTTRRMAEGFSTTGVLFPSLHVVVLREETKNIATCNTKD